MKFLPLQDFDLITSALNFTTPDCRVIGGCDLYTTKAAGSDKKLYKTIDRSLEQQHAALLKFGASLSPPQRAEMAASLNLSRSSPFGALSEISSRRTFAYLIATLNASHPDYDFSHVLRPGDFRRERSLKKVMGNIDYTLNNVRPQALSSSFLSNPSSSFRNYATSPSGPTMNSAMSSPAWGPHMWTLIDKEMQLKDCNIFSYQPADDPFDGEEAAIWSLHYFFFNKTLKRVAYLYVRGVPAMSLGTSPAATANPHHSRLGARTKARRGSNMSNSSHSHARRAGSVLSLRGPAGIKKESSSSSAIGASKRAKFWLGDKFAERIVASDGEDDETMGVGDQVMWDPDEDVELDPLRDGEGFAFGLASDNEDSSSFLQESSEDEEDEDEDEIVGSPVRGMSEDIAARLEIE